MLQNAFVDKRRRETVLHVVVIDDVNKMHLLQSKEISALAFIINSYVWSTFNCHILCDPPFVTIYMYPDVYRGMCKNNT